MHLTVLWTKFISFSIQVHDEVGYRYTKHSFRNSLAVHSDPRLLLNANVLNSGLTLLNALTDVSHFPALSGLFLLHENDSKQIKNNTSL